MLRHFREMLKLQANVNGKINPQWLTAGYPYLRAVLVESAEAMDHHGWKWWACQTPEMDQLRLELIDIWHFALSHELIKAAGDLDAAATHVDQAWNAGSGTLELHVLGAIITPLTLLDRLQAIAGLAAFGQFDVALFRAACQDAGLDVESLFRSYVGKNVLNHFRQDHGYKTGKYVKVWEGREDNEHLTELMPSLDAAPEDLWGRLYQALELRYPNSD